MAGDITLGLRLTADAKGFVGEVKLSKAELDKLGGGARKAGDDAKRLGRDLDTATRSTGGLGASLKGLASSFLNVRTILGTLLGSAGLGLLVNKSVGAADAIAKAADVAGLGAERLQTLRFAADQTGVGAAGLDDSMKRLNRRLGEFINSGGGPAAAAFKLLGVDAEIAAGKVRNSEQAFDAIAERIRAIPDAARQAALAAQLFGDDFGPRMALLLSQGTTGIADLEAKARSLGIVIDRAIIEKAVSAQDEMSALTAVIDAQKTVIGVELAPIIIAITREFTEWSRAVGAVARGIAGIGAEALHVEMQRLTSQQRAVVDELVALEARERARGRLTPDESERFTFMRAEADRLRDAISGVQDALDKVFNPPAATPPPVATGLGGIGDAAADAEERVKSLERALRDAILFEPRAARGDLADPAAADAAGAPLPGFGFPGAADELARRRRAASPALALEHELAEVNELMRRAGETAGQNAVIFDDMWQRSAAGARDVGAEIDRSIGSALDRMIDNLAAGAASWQDFARIAIDGIREVVFALAGITGQGGIGSSLASGIASIGAGLFGGGGGAALPDIAHAGGVIGAESFPRRLVDPRVFLDAARMHGGGVMGIGPTEHPVIVEQGEGVFTPAQMRALGGRGGVKIEQHFDFRGADRSAVAQLRQAAGDIMRATMDAIEADAQRGGRFAKLPRR